MLNSICYIFVCFFVLSFSMFCFSFEETLRINDNIKRDFCDKIFFVSDANDQNIFVSLDTTNGNLCVCIKNDSKKQFSFDTDFVSARLPEYKLLFKFRAEHDIRFSDIKGLMEIEQLNPRRISFKLSRNITPPKPKHKLILFLPGESFITQIKIWDIDIWSQVEKAFNEHPEKTYLISFCIAFDKNYPILLLSIDNVLFQHLQNIKNNLNDKTPSRQFEYKDKPSQWYLEGNHLEILSNQKRAYEIGVIPTVKCQINLNSNGELSFSIMNSKDVLITLSLEQSILKHFKIHNIKRGSTSKLADTKKTEPSFSRSRVVDLEEGEGFRWFANIKNLNIWSEIQDFFTKNPNQICYISNEILCWIDNKEYHYTVEYNLDYVTFQKLQEEKNRSITNLKTLETAVESSVEDLLPEAIREEAEAM